MKRQHVFWDMSIHFIEIVVFIMVVSLLMWSPFIQA